MLDTFLAGKHNANPLNILVNLQLLGLCLHNAYQFKVLLHLIRSGNFRNPQLRDSGDRELRQSKPSHDFPIPLNTMFALCLPPFGGIPMQNYRPPILPHFWGVRLDLGGRNCTNRMSTPHSYSTVYTLNYSDNI